MRTLLLLRHAQAASPPGVPDIDRPLTEPGRQQAEAVGPALADVEGGAVDLVLCSTARRASETAAALGVAAPLREASELYLAEAEALVQRIGLVDAEGDEAVRSLLVVAHNPGLQALAHALVADEADREILAGPFPPATLAILRAPIRRWSDLRPGTCELSSVRRPA